MRMSRRWILGVAASLALAGPAAAQPAGAPTGPLWREGPASSPEPELVRLNTALTRLAEQLKPALVQIRVQRPTEEPDPEEGPRRALGSGFVIHPSGLRRHQRPRRRALDDASRCGSPRADGSPAPSSAGTGASTWPWSRSTPPEPLPVLPARRLRERLAVGELVLALGHPFGLEQTVSLGIVSRKGAPLQAAAPGFDFIQTDAAVNPGNSGGPLVDMGGQVVGVNTMAARNGSIGFAIPINLIKTLLPQLLAKGTRRVGLARRADRRDHRGERPRLRARRAARRGDRGRPAGAAGRPGRDPGQGRHPAGRRPGDREPARAPASHLDHAGGDARAGLALAGRPGRRS